MSTMSGLRVRSAACKAAGSLRNLSSRLGVLAVLAALVVWPAAAVAGPPPAIPTYTDGSTIVNPITSANETVLDGTANHPGYVTTTTGDTILVATVAGQSFVQNGLTFTVISDSSNVVTYSVSGGNPNSSQPLVSQTGGASGTGTGTFTPATGGSDQNIFSDQKYGANGGNGHVGVLFVPAGNGGDGAAGPNVSDVVPASPGPIISVSDGLPGVTVSSNGGNGGNGGNAYLSFPGGAGGKGGAGGNVAVTNNAAITTSGQYNPANGLYSYGILAESSGGQGGNGGNGYAAGGGNAGAGPSQAGSVSVVNNGQITTTGDGAIGIVAESLGGSAGQGGSSYGIVGDPGGGQTAGNGGTVSVTQNSNIQTSGLNAAGVLAQSIGGSGGNAGVSGGLVALAATAGVGGDGGEVDLTAGAGSSVHTGGDGSAGLIAQSVGGGGGNASISIGLVALGSNGGGAGAGGTVNLTLQGGSTVTTLGNISDGVIAQSVGGGGGGGAIAGGIVAVGGKGANGGNGGAVTVITAGAISTYGDESRGVFAQSIGGGGGNASGVGGLVALGGSGAGGGAGGDVSVTQQAGGSVYTQGVGSDAIFAQSVGGGGGAGAAAGGLVALGGSGQTGGAGGTVYVENDGGVATYGDLSKGIFAQSVGGGGGSGGFGGGLASIGGSGSGTSAGGQVTVDNTGTIYTYGAHSTGIQAQSIGGGGGDGGTSGGVLFTIGGTGGGGGGASLVTVTDSGSITTVGSDAHGIFAQSVGGGGGAGGAAYSGSLFAGAAVGGSAGNGGNGGEVDLNLVASGGVTPAINTAGDRSRGVFVQSVGGGGGSGGEAVQVSVGFIGAASVAVGGSGGGGGTGGVVNVAGNVAIETLGANSEGFYAQSVGGGGGAGGGSVSVALAGGPGAGSLSMAIGGSGGSGGAGGQVTVQSGGSIVTQGDFSTGFEVQSVGGGGGSGGYAVSVSGSGGVAGSISASIGVGGSGGDGGLGGSATGVFDGTILTRGESALGAIVQSVGGGGGVGGFDVSVAVSGSGGVSGAVAVGLGGSGGGGGAGGVAIGTVGGNVQTYGDRSNGVVVQSVGGGGGDGGFNISGSIAAAGGGGLAASVGLGGSGGGGGNGGSATGEAQGSIYTAGTNSAGLVVQSVGGGGGAGGFNVSGSIGVGGEAGVSASVGLGGSGGGGGNGGTVVGSADSLVWTSGAMSNGVVVQSVGGGGGNGGFNVAGAISGGGTAGIGVAVGLGGSGGLGGAGGDVTATAHDIYTFGDQSSGFVAQSIGGGGGSGGFNVSGAIGVGGTVGGVVTVGIGGAGGGGGMAGDVTASVYGDVTTYGSNAGAIFAQSAGGGGGSGGFNVSGGISAAGEASLSVGVGVGGSGGGGGSAGAVNLTVIGTTQTGGAFSDAVVAQAIGGGGGSGGFNVTGGISASGGGAGSVGVSVGGSGGGGGAGGNVTVDINQGQGGGLLAASTMGDNSRGVLVQSVGGGGGDGGFSVTGGVSVSEDAAGNVGVGVGGSGGIGGSGGTVIANITGSVTTQGAQSAAIFVQSLGGGGGNGGFNISGGIAGSTDVSGNLMVGVGGFGGSGGNGGAVSGAVTGDITTAGTGASGVTYQSLGGGGGDGGFNITGGVSLNAGGSVSGTVGVGVGGFGGGGGSSSTVNASMTGNISTTGDNAYGALFQSAAGGGGSGGFNVTGGISAGSGASGVLGVGVGGFGGGGGTAGDVTGTLVGDVTTLGANAYGAKLQSQGGAGGDGGLNVTGGLSLSVENNASGSIGVGVGGFGGNGGAAGAVTGYVTGQYVTSGSKSDGVIAESVGGGGGSGGLNVTGNVALSTGTAGSVGVGIGGFGGGGGDGGSVNLTRVGDTFTSGAGSDGVTAQSIGGGGGAGGVNITGDLAASTSGTNVALGFGLGGFGGGGGAGGDVALSVTGNVLASGLGGESGTVTITPGTYGGSTDVITRADGSNGVVAQSIGGGGGEGGLDVTGTLALTKPSGGGTSIEASIGIGGFGGAGGNAGTVNLTIVAPGASPVWVTAIGDDRSAVIAQSIGGGGGTGGINISGGVSMGGALQVGIGGFGGAGGTGGDVDALVHANLQAAGDLSNGLLAQSVGGGGGAGGVNISGTFSASKTTDMPSVAFGLGGFGGAGNASGNVTVDQSGQITVEGSRSNGILAQSVAGGGGSGGLDITSAVTLSNTETGFAAAIGVGGSGGAGANAGAVDLRSVGDIFVNTVATTSGGVTTYSGVTYYDADSAGIIAQSLGGGGGVGGINITGAVAPNGQPLAIGVGGSGADGGDGGSVTVARGYALNGGVETAAAAQIVVFGDASPGLLAQSVGGGGGRAGVNVTVAETNAATGDDPVAALITVGGGGGDAGNGGTVSVRQNGSIYTAGSGSDGLEAQSVGGGGGNANYNIGLGYLKNTNALNLAVGGAVGAGGSGGAVTVDNVGLISTTGDSSVGLLAQSLGGGGGNTVLDLAMGLGTKNALNITVGRQGGAGGTASDVVVTQNGTITTQGDMSSGLLAQSIGGGGGNSSATSVGVAGKGADADSTDSYQGTVSVGIAGGVGATSGDVAVTAAGLISTVGSDSKGIMAESIGGGGGMGGAASTTIFNQAGAVGVAVGGAGGTGATSGAVTVATSAAILTSGDRSDGVLAQSIGGGGGVGGSVRTINFEANLPVIGGPGSSDLRALTISVGGSGGTGADAGAVSVTNTGIIETAGFQSFGVRAQSIGGGGGVGGAVLNLNLQANASNSADNDNVNVGGSGGSGGTGAAVTVLNQGLIYTTGQQAAGVVATSIGGGGGDAGLVLNVTAGLAGPNSETHDFNLNIGGSGGSGGGAGAVTVTNQATGGQNSGVILTQGQGAYGVLAQSIGGGGGNGSSIISITALSTSTDSSSTGLSIGGSGGSGNTAGAVTVNNYAVIQTSGDGAHGILAQSIGGGGGNGGMSIAANVTIGEGNTNSTLISVGGSGGNGANAGAVTVNNTGSILTTGVGADGIVAQSIGGGGGNANLGLSLAGPFNTAVVNNTLSALIGSASGGSGGLGGAVTVNQAGDITVTGAQSQAILAQSINGGGGTLSLDFSGITGLPGAPYVNVHGQTVTPDPLIVAQNGGTGNSGMGGGLVTENITGTFGAGGADSAGGFLQTIGGGGGLQFIIIGLVGDPNDPTITQAPVAIPVQVTLGGTNGSNNPGGAVSSGFTGAVTTMGADSPAQFVQSIGGGGGWTVTDVTAPQGSLLGPVSASLGGTNGQNEAGGAIGFTQAGALTTSGAVSPGALIQSVGGGGGVASVNVSGAGAAGVPITLAFGSNGGTGLGGGAVAATFTGGVTTTGDHSVGLIVQSVGAGGGVVLVGGDPASGVTLGGYNGASGDGGAIAATDTGNISTTGVGSHGVFLQSVGGGGGAVFGDPTTVTLNTSNSGDGGPIAFTQIGDITASGLGAYGIIAQSVGGGGGWVDGVFYGTAGGSGHGGAISLGVVGAIDAPTAGAFGVFAQSAGGLGGGNIAITLTSGSIVGGTGAGAGVGFAGGADNSLVNYGTIEASNGIPGYAVRGGAGNEAVDNYSLVVGSLDLGTGHNSFYNHLGATFIAGPQLLLAAGGLLTNAGVLQIGPSAPMLSQDLAAAQVTTETGDFLQTATGHMLVDISYGAYPSDQLNVAGHAALGGEVDVTLLKLTNDQPYHLITTTAGAAVNGAVAPGTLALSYGLVVDGLDIDLTLTPHFDSPLDRPNAQALGRFLNHTLDVGGADNLNNLLLFLGELQDLPTYRRSIDLLSPEVYLAPFQTMMYEGRDAASNVLSCHTADGISSAINEGGCVWVKAEGQALDRKGTDADFGFHDENVGLSTGVQRRLGDSPWLLGLGLGWDHHSITLDTVPAGFNGDLVSGAAAVKWQQGDGLVALSLAGGGGQMTGQRTIDLPGPNLLPGDAKSTFDVYFVQADLRAAWLFSHGAVYAKPQIDLNLDYESLGAFQETGAGVIGSRSPGTDHVGVSARPAVEFGATLGHAGGQVFRPWLTLGFDWKPDAKFDLPVAFVGSIPQAGTYTQTSRIDRAAAVINAGFDLVKAGRYDISVAYDGDLGSDYKRQGGRIKVSIPF